MTINLVFEYIKCQIKTTTLIQGFSSFPCSEMGPENYQDVPGINRTLMGFKWARLATSRGVLKSVNDCKPGNQNTPSWYSMSIESPQVFRLTRVIRASNFFVAEVQRTSTSFGELNALWLEYLYGRNSWHGINEEQLRYCQ